MDQNDQAVANQQLKEVINPGLYESYTIRQHSDGQYWFVSNRKTGAIFTLRFEGINAGWTIRSVFGQESEREELEQKVKALCNPNP